MVMFGTFDQILTYMGFSLGIFPILAIEDSRGRSKSARIRMEIPASI